MKNIKQILFALVAVVILNACSPADGNRTGSEYMPDMGHSIAQEANVYNYYYLNTWDSASTVRLKDLSSPGLPVEGTVPRGYTGAYFASEHGMSSDAVMAQISGEGSVNSMPVPANGHVPYYYPDTEAGRTQATAELLANPYPITEKGLEAGEELYNIYCGICHGTKGDGVGYLVSDDNRNAKYPAAPANFLLEDFVNSSNGRYYHAIMYGKNVMGGYTDKLSYEERWQVIHWIRALQAKENKVEYSAEVNTLNPVYGTPASQVVQMAEHVSDEEVTSEETTTDDHHGDDGHHEGDEHHDDHKNEHGEDSHSHGRK